MVLDGRVTAVLRMKVGVGGGPSKPRGKFLALALCLRVDSSNEKLPDKLSLYTSVRISARLGAEAYQDLVRCQWIQDRCFDPKIKEDHRVSEYMHVIRNVLNGFYDQSDGWAAQWQPKGLSVNNRLLLVILLDQANSMGRVGPTSLGELAKLTGFSLNQIKVQLQKLKEIGLVCGVVPGVTGATLFGKAKSHIYLNFLHPYWSYFFPGWRAVCLDSSLWQEIAKSEGDSLQRFMGENSRAELVSRPALGRYFRNLVLVLISDALSRHWHDLGLSNLTSVLQMRRVVADKLLRSQLPASHVEFFLTDVACIAQQLQSELCNGESDLKTRIGLEPPEPWRFCVLPQFGDQPQPMVVLTNCPHLWGEINAEWLRTSSPGQWVEKGLVTNPNAAPLKLRTHKLKAT